MFKFLLPLIKIIFPEKEILEKDVLKMYSQRQEKGVYYLFSFKDVKDTIHQFKYRSNKTAISVFQKSALKFLHNKLSDRENYVITSIPETKIRERVDGFSHLDLICNYVSKNLNNVEYVKTLSFQKKVLRQSQLRNFKDRHENIKESMKLNKTVEKKIILFDDIFTSGATLNEAKRVLLENGMDIHLVFTIAH